MRLRLWLLLALAILVLGASYAQARAAEAPEVKVLWPSPLPYRWSSHRTPERLKREFARYEWRTDMNGALIWDFEIKPGQPNFADLFYDRPLNQPFKTLHLRLQLHGAPVIFAFRLTDAQGIDYVVNFGKLYPSKVAYDLEVPLQAFKVGSWVQVRDADGALTFPTRHLGLIAFDVPQEKPLQLKLERLSAEELPPLQVRLEEFSLPSNLKAGEAAKLQARLVLVNDYPLKAPLQLNFEGPKGYRFKWRLAEPVKEGWKAGQLVKVQHSFKVPKWAWKGRYSLAFTLAGQVVEPAGTRLPVVDVAGEQGGRLLTTEIRRTYGNPQLFIEDTPSAELSYMTYRPGARYFKQFADARVHLYSFAATCSAHNYNLAKPVWVAPDKFDYSEFDQRVELILEQDPDALIFPRVYIAAPGWWMESHPEDLVYYEDANDQSKLLLQGADRPAASFASQAFRRDMSYALKQLIKHAEAAPWSQHIVGYHIASGTTEEWMYWGCNDNKYADYSQAARRAFKQWLKAKYKTDEALQKAWGDPKVTFEDAEIPSHSKRIASEFGEFRDPVRAKDVIDYSLFLSDITVDTIEQFAHVVKRETQGKAMVGTFYGYVLQLSGGMRLQQAGHLAVERLLKCPDVDFLTSPTSYAFRTLDDRGYTHFMSLVDSVKLHDKLWMDENDIRTFLVKNQPGWGYTDNYADTLKLQQREFGAVEGQACGMWWFDMGGGWYDDARLLEQIGKMNAIGEALKTTPRGNVDEIAVLVEPESLAYLKTAGVSADTLLRTQLPELGRIGAPVGYYLLSDLPKLADHKFFIFLAAFKLDQAQVETIKRVVEQPGKVALWYFAPGLASDEGLSEARMQAVTGLPLHYEVKPGAPRLSWTERAAGQLHVEAGTTFGDRRRWLSRVVCAPGKGEVWAQFADGEPGLVLVQRKDGFTSAWSGGAPLPAKFLRYLADLAGVHSYVPAGDVVYARKGLVVVWSSKGGTREVTLPRPAEVTELFSGKQLARNSERFPLVLERGGTALLQLH